MSEDGTVALVSTSGGKDSTATLLLALEQMPKDRVFPVFADTGHEHELTYEYLGYLERRLGVTIKRLRVNFIAEWWAKRDYVRDKWPAKLRAGRPGRWEHALEDHDRITGCEVFGCARNNCNDARMRLASWRGDLTSFPLHPKATEENQNDDARVSRQRSLEEKVS